MRNPKFIGIVSIVAILLSVMVVVLSIGYPKQCKRGTFYANGKSPWFGKCTKCNVGTYSDVRGAATADTCKQCKVGTYSDIPGAATCTKCNAGTYSDVTGATTADTCTKCLTHTYSGPGSDRCYECQDGYYTSNTGSKQCSQIPSDITYKKLLDYKCPAGGSTECDVQDGPTCLSGIGWLNVQYETSTGKYYKKGNPNPCTYKPGDVWYYDDDSTPPTQCSGDTERELSLGGMTTYKCPVTLGE